MTVRRSIDEIKLELTRKQIEQLERAERMPVIFDKDCPEFTDEMAKESYRPGRIQCLCRGVTLSLEA